MFSPKQIAFAAVLCVPYFFAFAIDLPTPQSTPVAPSKTDVELRPAPPTNPNAARGPGSATTVGGPKAIRKKDLSFEGRGVDVLLGKDYDSLSQTGTVENANREKLYKTRLFMNESENLLQELEYSR